MYESLRYEFGGVFAFNWNVQVGVISISICIQQFLYIDTDQEAEPPLDGLCQSMLRSWWFSWRRFREMRSFFDSNLVEAAWCCRTDEKSRTQWRPREQQLNHVLHGCAYVHVGKLRKILFRHDNRSSNRNRSHSCGIKADAEFHFFRVFKQDARMPFGRSHEYCQN